MDVDHQVAGQELFERHVDGGGRVTLDDGGQHVERARRVLVARAGVKVRRLRVARAAVHLKLHERLAAARREDRDAVLARAVHRGQWDADGVVRGGGPECGGNEQQSEQGCTGVRGGRFLHVKTSPSLVALAFYRRRP